MKNEDRIVEILAETLIRQDKHEEILKKLLESQEKFLQSQDKLVDGQERLILEFHKMNDHLLTKQDKIEDRVIRLEDAVFRK